MDGKQLIDTFVQRASGELPKYFWGVEDDPAGEKVLVLYREKVVESILYDEIWFGIGTALDRLAQIVKVTLEAK